MRKFTGMALAVIATTALTPAARAQEAPQGDAANGKRIFLKEACFTCHGRVGEGGAYNGPAPILAH
ncbi:MAG: c-type cytochrome, partial [Xanthobacteraceae bacterium]